MREQLLRLALWAIACLMVVCMPLFFVVTFLHKSLKRMADEAEIALLLASAARRVAARRDGADRGGK